MKVNGSQQAASVREKNRTRKNSCLGSKFDVNLGHWNDKVKLINPMVVSTRIGKGNYEKHQIPVNSKLAKTIHSLEVNPLA